MYRASWQIDFKVSSLGWTGVCLWTLLCGSPRSAEAEVIVDSTGFEAPDYGVGPLAGQQGWQTTVAAPQSGANVQNTTVFSGSQAVSFDRAANVDERLAVPVAGFPTKPVVLINWDMRVDPTASTAFGPFFGVEAYDGAGALGLLGALGVDATTGDVLYQAQDTGFLVETGALVGLGEWNHYQIALDFVGDEYRVFLNGGLLATTGFVDRGLGLDDFTDADLSALAAAGDPVSQGLTGRAYFDNFVVLQVPEPQTLIMVLIVVGMGICVARRTELSAPGRFV